MFAIVIILLICSFVTLWCFIFAANSSDMSLREYFTGKDISGTWRNDIIHLQTEMKKQEERITRLETHLFIAENSNSNK